MNPALWGGLCALSWGGADFAARFTGRALGHHTALLGMLVVGSVVLSLWVWLGGARLDWDASALWLLAVCGVFTMVATLLLYDGLARGPVTIVSPIAASYPALVVVFWVVVGARPTLVQWAAMAATMAGVVVVARSAKRFEEPGVMSIGCLRKSVMLALGSSLSFTVVVISGQAAVPFYGELQTLWVSRLISLAAIALLFLVRGEAPRMVLRWWPLIALQGLLDAGAYLALFAGSHGEGSELAAVAASGFGAVTVLLARVFLREAMSWAQWGGVVMVFAGVAVLSAVS
ncbi:MAG: DMT family transporter [Alphaproteobacteria bacterium]